MCSNGSSCEVFPLIWALSTWIQVASDLLTCSQTHFGLTNIIFFAKNNFNLKVQQRKKCTLFCRSVSDDLIKIVGKKNWPDKV